MANTETFKARFQSATNTFGDAEEAVYGVDVAWSGGSTARPPCLDDNVAATQFWIS